MSTETLTQKEIDEIFSDESPRPNHHEVMIGILEDLIKMLEEMKKVNNPYTLAREKLDESLLSDIGELNEAFMTDFASMEEAIEALLRGEIDDTEARQIWSEVNSALCNE